MKKVEGRAREMALDQIVDLLSRGGRKAPVPNLRNFGDANYVCHTLGLLQR